MQFTLSQGNIYDSGGKSISLEMMIEKCFRNGIKIDHKIEDVEILLNVDGEYKKETKRCDVLKFYTQ